MHGRGGARAPRRHGFETGDGRTDETHHPPGRGDRTRRSDRSTDGRGPAAGNSGDEHFYDDALTNDPEIYAWDFEVGAPLWNEEDQQWDTSAGGFFWPDFETEGFAQAMEFANGWYGILEVARQFALDDDAPTSSANVDGRGTYAGPVDVLFETSEPATIHYTTDGSRPTWDSPTVEREVVRGGAAPVTITGEGTTTLQWFAVDEAGNVEGGYDPDTPARDGLNRVVVKIR